MLLVVAIAAFIATTVLPDINTVAVHHSILERALEVAAISPLKAPIAAHFVLAPHARILRTVCPEVASLAFLDTLPEKSVVVAAIRPYLNTLSITLVLWVCHLGTWLLLFEIVEHVLTLILAEYAQVCQSVVLPIAFIRF